jgi:hypothetical protein
MIIPNIRLANSNSAGLYSVSTIPKHDITNEASIGLDDVDDDHRDSDNHQHQNHDSSSPPDSIHSQGSNGSSGSKSNGSNGNKSNGSNGNKSNGSNGNNSNGSTKSYGFLHIDKRDISNSPDDMI